MKNKKYIYNNIQFDSQEEIDFQKFLEEGKQIGLIKDWVYHPQSFILIPKAVTLINGKTKVLYREHKYTPDWIFTASLKFDKLNHGLKKNSDNTYIVDIKGMYNRHGGDRIFPLNAKLMYKEYQLHVNKLIPDLFFKNINIVPEGVRFMQNRKTPTLKKAYEKIGTFAEFKESENKIININKLKKR